MKIASRATPEGFVARGPRFEHHCCATTQHLMAALNEEGIRLIARTQEANQFQFQNVTSVLSYLKVHVKLGL